MITVVGGVAAEEEQRLMCLPFHHSGPACLSCKGNELSKPTLAYVRMTLRCIINSRRVQSTGSLCWTSSTSSSLEDVYLCPKELVIFNDSVIIRAKQRPVATKRASLTWG